MDSVPQISRSTLTDYSCLLIFKQAGSVVSSKYPTNFPSNFIPSLVPITMLRSWSIDIGYVVSSPVEESTTLKEGLLHAEQPNLKRLFHASNG